MISLFDIKNEFPDGRINHCAVFSPNIKIKKLCFL